MKSIAIIPARGGSKAIPRKNIIELGGKPLIAYVIEAALKVKKLDRVIVSTEDMEIAEITKKYGAELPFLRPKELAKDETPTLPVLQHAVRVLEEKEDNDEQAREKIIARAIELSESNEAFPYYYLFC